MRPAKTEPAHEALIVFARFPEPGRTKTRLIPLLGPAGAAEAYRRLAEATAREALLLERAGLERSVWIEPASRTAEGARWFGSAFRCRPQPEGDLGARLGAAFAEAFASGAERVIAIGTDCPGLDAARLGRAFDLLASWDAVLGPAADGGYYLIGLAREMPRVFDRIPWSTSEVLQATLRRLGEERAVVACLETLRDLDTPEDFRALGLGSPESSGGTGD